MAGNVPVLAPLFASLRPFDPSEISLSGWLQLFNEFCAVNQIALEPPANNNGLIPHNRRRALFLSYVGHRAYEALRSDCLPHMPNHFSIQQLTALLKVRYEPPGMTTTSRFTFQGRNQRQDESAAEYIAQLQLLAARCDFGMYYFDAMRDKLVSGIRSNECRIKLLAIPDLTFDRAKDFVIQDDAVRAEARLIAQANVNASVNAAVPSGFRTRRSGRGPNNQGGQAHGSQKGQIKSTQRSWGPCFRCTRKHDATTCPAKAWKCFSCQAVGHIANSKACKKSRKQHQANAVIASTSGSSSGAVVNANLVTPSIEQEVNNLLRVSNFQVNSSG